MSQWKKINAQKKQKKIQSNVSNQLLNQRKDDLTEEIKNKMDQNVNLMGSLLLMQQEMAL